MKSNQCQKYPVPVIQFTIGRVLIVRVGYKSYGAVFTTILVTSNAVWGGPLSNVASYSVVWHHNYCVIASVIVPICNKALIRENCFRGHRSYIITLLLFISG